MAGGDFVCQGKDALLPKIGPQISRQTAMEKRGVVIAVDFLVACVKGHPTPFDVVGKDPLEQTLHVAIGDGKLRKEVAPQVSFTVDISGPIGNIPFVKTIIRKSVVRGLFRW